MLRFSLKSVLLTLGLLMIPVFGYVLWSSPDTLDTVMTKYPGVGGGVKQDFQSLPTLPLTEEKDSFILTDNTSDGIDIQFANQSEVPLLGTESPKLNLTFPKDYSQPIVVKLDDKRTVNITDLSGKSDYQVETLGQEVFQIQPENSSFLQKFFPKKEQTPQTYLRYTSDDGRKSLLYAYQKDQASGEKKLKHWTLYENGDGIEQESYRIENAKVKVNSEGVVEVFYYTEQDLKNDQAATEVDSNLLARAQRTLAREMGEDLLNGNKTPDFTIPKPYYIDAQGEKHKAEWKWNEEASTLSVSFSPASYPVALDPTLAFTAPGQSNTGSVITGESGGNFGYSFTAGDFNADGKMDLAVGDRSIGSGRVYIFYNDGGYTANATGADRVITGQSSSDEFGYALVAGDFNADGTTDLVVGADGYNGSGSTGRAYLFYNDGSIPTTAATADVIITGETLSNYFGSAFSAGDYNADGKTDLAIGAYGYSTSTGRAYLFYNDGSIPTTAATADVIITGETTNNFFGASFASGDFNADGKTDLAIGAYGYSSSTGRAYIFNNDGSIPTTAATADTFITGEASSNSFGISLTAGDFNADGRVDLGIGAYGYSSNTGRAYLFYNDGSIPTTAATADVIITGEGSSNYFGYVLTAADFNADGKTDLSVGAYVVSKIYIFYSQNGQVSTNRNITGEAATDNFTYALTTGEWNADGRADLAVGAYGYSSETGRVYIFYGDGQVPTTAATADIIMTGNATGDRFGWALTAGDYNADGRADIAVGAPVYSTSTGRTYVFYGGSIITEGASGADVTITGETTSNNFGTALVSGDFNADSKTDIAVAGSGYDTPATDTGRAYIFYNGAITTENASGADVAINGETSSNFGMALTAGDYNGNGTIDLVVSAYSSNGRVYIFYNDGSYPSGASTADVSITGETAGDFFGVSGLTSGDFNTDGKTDIAAGSNAYSSNTGRVYIFYADGTNNFGTAACSGSSPTLCSATNADVQITGETTSNEFATVIAGDFNADGRTDLAVGAYRYASFDGRAYIFYNDGSYPSGASSADVTIGGDVSAGSYFGSTLVTGDMNGDGRTDLMVGARGYNTAQGKVYFYETRENFAWQVQKQFTSGITRTGVNTAGQEIQITGESGAFGYALSAGDWNADGKVDLAVGAYTYATNTGRTYIFYNDGSLPTGAASADVVIVGEATSNYFGSALSSGDMNGDGKNDLIVGAQRYTSYTGRVYIFYNDGSYPASASSADVIITGNTGGDQFGYSLVTGDMNADGRTDLVVGAQGYSAGGSTGRAYLFYGDGSMPTTAATADVTITGEATSNYFGSLAAGDWNNDGKVDLAIGAYGYSSFAGRAYIFYNGSIITESASGADVIITGSAGDGIGYSLVSGDFNFDGKVDLATGAVTYNASDLTGRVYIFYGDGSIPTTAATADVTITGEATGNQFGNSLVAGDWNADGRTDLAVGAVGYSSNTGRTYIFNNDGSYPSTAATADSILTGESGSFYGYSLATGDYNSDGKADLVVGAYNTLGKGRVYLYTFNDPVITGGASSDFFGYALAGADFNADGRTDLAVGAYDADSLNGRVYLFYNDGSLPTTATTADVTITGSDMFAEFGSVLTVGDWNADGRTDLAASAVSYDFFGATGRVHLFYNDGTFPTTSGSADVTITGEASGNSFGNSLTVGDWNADGRVDLAVGARGYSTFTGRAYIFYGDGSIPTTAATADVLITGEATSNLFGYALTNGDFNADGRADLVVGAAGYNPGGAASTGRAYIFYGDGSLPTTAGTADVIISGDAAGDNFGTALAGGDLNVDGKSDLIISAQSYASSTGRVYILYADGSLPTTAATADVTITGDATNDIFGNSLTVGDWNADGRVDLAVGARGYSTFTGRVYIFNNDGSYPTTATTADSVVTGITTNNNFGRSLTVGDWNTDGRVDLAVGASGYSSNKGQVYVFSSEVALTSTPPGTFYMKGTGKLKGTGTIK